MIYETDTDLVRVWSGSAWVEVSSMLTKAPRGVMGYVVRNTGNITSTTTLTDVTGASITFNALSSRLYEVSFSCQTRKVSGAGYVNIIIADGANNNKFDFFTTTSDNEYTALSFTGLISGVSGSTTLKVRSVTDTGTGTIFGSAGNPYSFIVKDIGPA
jgi:hypothetical protein